MAGAYVQAWCDKGYFQVAFYVSSNIMAVLSHRIVEHRESKGECDPKILLMARRNQL